MRDEIRTIQEMMEGADYVTDAAIATSVYLGMTLKKPLLIEGHAGVGKTEVAKVMARMLETNLIRLQCYEGLDAAAGPVRVELPEAAPAHQARGEHRALARSRRRRRSSPSPS